MTRPYINLNGTSREALKEQQMAVCKASAALLQAMNDASPHGRDYRSTADWQAAREAWGEQYLRVARMEQEALDTAIWMEANDE